jgi:two-component system, cell cycle response regulator
MRILVAEHDTATMDLLGANLNAWGYEVVQCSSGTEAWQVLDRESPPKLAILEWDLPEISGAQICRRVRELEGRPYIYIILLCSEGSKKDVLSCLEAGADDYAVKPVDTDELRLRLLAGSRIVGLQDTFISVLKCSELQAAHDPLTGLWNRPAIADLLKRELARSQRDRTPLGVIVAGLDQFRQINDRFGQITADAILREVVLRIHSAVRSYDCVGRLSEEDFVIIAPGCDSKDTRALADRLRTSVSKFRTNVADEPISLSMSCGAVSVDGTGHRTPESTFKAASDALQSARTGGSGRVEVRSETTLDRSSTLEA